jgi:hypothetical protein
MPDSEYRSFREFWPFYVGQHRRPLCRVLHYAAAVAGLGLLAVGCWRASPALIALAPVAGYGLAWFAHFCVERNDPATFRYARWSLLAEFRMLGLALRGRMGAEVQRLYPAGE